MAMQDVRGYCPMGCGETLFLGEGGYVTCSWFSCPMPDAVSRLIEDRPETGHIAVFADDDTFTIEHSVRERLSGSLFDCPLQKYLTSLVAAPVSPGRYRVNKYDQAPYGWTFMEITETENENG